MFEELVVLVICIREVSLQINWTLVVAGTLVFSPIGPMVPIVYAKNATN